MSKRIVFLAAVALLSLGAVVPSQAEVNQINGAGATFPYPIYAKWADAYHKATGIQLNYQSIGSGGGVRQIKQNTVDFGASDAPMKPEELDKYGMIQWPQVMGGVVPVVNLPGIGSGEIRLDGTTLADIFLGRIKKWNDKRIAALNPGVNLPAKAITVVHRSDGSGTTFIFTNYLTKVSPTWAKDVGGAKAVSWPAGVGGKGNEGVASYVKRIKGAIGYVEYAYALQNKMTYTLLRNKSGNYVAPTSANFQAAAAGAEWGKARHYYLILTDQPGAKAWPITGASFIIVYAKAKQPEHTAAVLKFFDWCFHHGQKMADALDYVPMPDKVVKMVETTWAKDIRTLDGAPVWTEGMSQK